MQVNAPSQFMVGSSLPCGSVRNRHQDKVRVWRGRSYRRTLSCASWLIHYTPHIHSVFPYPGSVADDSFVQGHLILVGDSLPFDGQVHKMAQTAHICGQTADEGSAILQVTEWLW